VSISSEKAFSAMYDLMAGVWEGSLVMMDHDRVDEGGTVVAVSVRPLCGLSGIILHQSVRTREV
jgi:hypothetical protein